jgi:hypothetical protein
MNNLVVLCIVIVIVVVVGFVCSEVFPEQREYVTKWVNQLYVQKPCPDLDVDPLKPLLETVVFDITRHDDDIKRVSTTVTASEFVQFQQPDDAGLEGRMTVHDEARFNAVALLAGATVQMEMENTVWVSGVPMETAAFFMQSKSASAFGRGLSPVVTSSRDLIDAHARGWIKTNPEFSGVLSYVPVSPELYAFTAKGSVHGCATVSSQPRDGEAQTLLASSFCQSGSQTVM